MAKNGHYFSPLEKYAPRLNGLIHSDVLLESDAHNDCVKGSIGFILIKEEIKFSIFQPEAWNRLCMVKMNV